MNPRGTTAPLATVGVQETLAFFALCVHETVTEVMIRLHCQENAWDFESFKKAFYSLIDEGKVAAGHASIHKRYFITPEGFLFALETLEQADVATSLKLLWNTIRPRYETLANAKFMDAALLYRQKQRLPSKNWGKCSPSTLSLHDYNLKDIYEHLFYSGQFWRVFVDSVLSSSSCENILERCLRARVGFAEDFAEFLIQRSCVREEYAVEYRQNCLFYGSFMRKGHPDDVLKKLPADSKYAFVLEAVKAMSQRQDSAVAVNLMRQALKASGLSRCFDEPILNWFYALALFHDRETPMSIKRLEMLSKLKWSHPGYCGEALSVWLAVAREYDIKEMVIKNCSMFPKHGVWGHLDADLYILSAVVFKYLPDIKPYADYMKELTDKYPLFLLEVLAATVSQEAIYRETCEKFGMLSLTSMTAGKPDWETVLDRLTLAQKKKVPSTGDRVLAKTRVVYFLDFENQALWLKQQKSRNGSTWSKGADLKLSAFKRGINDMTEQDKAVQACLEPDRWDASRMRVNFREVLKALIGHPAVFNFNGDVRMDIVQEPIAVTVKQENSTWHVTTNCPQEIDTKYQRVAYKLSASGDKATVYCLDDEERLLVEQLRQVCVFPKAAESKLKGYLELLSRTTPVLTDLLVDSQALAHVKGETRIVFRIHPTDDGLFSVETFVRPLPNSEIMCVPGKGVDYLAINLKDQTVQVERDLRQEKDNFDTLIGELHALDAGRQGQTHWLLDMHDCLYLLDTLHAHAEIAAIEWPQGAKFKVSHSRLNTDALNLSVRTMGQWFTVEGKIKLNAKTVLTIADLLEKLQSAQGNFIRLSDTEYIALTDAFKKQLGMLSTLTVGSRKKGELKVSKFNAVRLEELDREGLALETDAGFRDLISRIKATEELDIKVPTGLKAELRDYQFDGFEWLTKLSNWGSGALLTDDMGLGKTVQTIAFLLQQAKKGPALVVVPTAVVGNWVDEMKRFAPSLNPVVYANQGKDERAKVLNKLKARDVVLVTYGILSADIDDFSAIKWATAVLDEAHAIKNRDTKMSKAVMQLTAEARVMLTGTPLQNHLSELWNLFEFANPGLLGNFEEFSERYVIPVEKNKDRERQRALKRLISPFILRRTKSEVVQELPEKTEITLRVKLSDEEVALYERLREKASVELETGIINPIQALAELLRLRQAACSPALVDPGLKDIASSKTAAFIDLVDELIAGNHRALVFSQFTSHLALIKDALDAKGIEYLYLDGSMTSTQRTKLVEKFQKGEMPLFLISLKAGGTGLNLTAADYVIHLDPWWNPAIENQASDRAYRIGQENPVTIYRLIAENTIEEKILRLHETKRSLADALLEGADMANRLSREEILKLLAS
ncbi:MAG: SNF2-related protein [Sutterellaceae bacterium]|nr:SNF2-related protein [Sutterellaceae bacterium]